MYGEVKDLILTALDLGPNRMHVILGLVSFTVMLAATRRPWLALAVVITLQLGNELLDAREDLARGRWRVREAMTDTAWNIALPMAIALFIGSIKRIPALRTARAGAKTDE